MDSLSAASVTEGARPALTPKTLMRPSRESYVFADNIRFLSMAAFFIEHAVPAADDVLNWKTPWFSYFMICLTKFGTIGFFVVSGFLLGKSIETSGALGYLKKRLDRVFVPWCFWISLFTVAMVFREARSGRKPLHGVGDTLVALGHKLAEFVVYTPYWFVPQLLVALCALLVFRRHLGSVWLGASLGAISLFYAANVYLHWLPPSHKVAFFGFTFYLWLGYFVSNRLEALERWSARVPYLPLIGLAVLLAVATCAECKLVGHLYPVDEPTNSLRLTSQLYSLVMVFLLFKVRVPVWPKLVDVRNDTFGLYLIQPIMLFMVSSVVFRCIPASAYAAMRSPQGAVLLWVVIAVSGYVGTLAVTKFLLSRASLRWMVGSAPVAAAGRRASGRAGIKETLTELMSFDHRVL